MITFQVRGRAHAKRRSTNDSIAGSKLFDFAQILLSRRRRGRIRRSSRSVARPQIFRASLRKFSKWRMTHGVAGNLRAAILKRMGCVLQDLAIGCENRASLVALMGLSPDHSYRCDTR